jgi:hypothetical protein
MSVFYNKEQKKITGITLAIIFFVFLAAFWVLK